AEPRVPDVRAAVPGGGRGGDDPGEAHRRHGRLRLPPRVQQHRGHDPLLRALPPPHPLHLLPHQGRPPGALHGAPRRPRQGLHRPLQAPRLRGGGSHLRGPLQQVQARPLHHAPRRRHPRRRPRAPLPAHRLAALPQVRPRLRGLQAHRHRPRRRARRPHLRG
ncbi:hypothetical protein CFC21_015256, partial [Triticum aestivum]